MKKSIFFQIFLILIGLYSCVEDESNLLNGDAIVGFAIPEQSTTLSYDFEADTIITATVQLVGPQSDKAISVGVELSEASTAVLDQEISFPQSIEILANSSSAQFNITIHGDKFDYEEEVMAQLVLSSNGAGTGANLSKLMVFMKKLGIPKCTKDFSKYKEPLSVTTGDSFGYYWDWNGRNDLTLVPDPNISNRFSNKNFYGWSDAQAVLFELSCDDNTVAVVPISGYSTPGGYTFDITGGTGTYDETSISVTYECSNTGDGNFTISETYTLPCGVIASEYAGPLSITTGDSFGYSWNWNGRNDLLLLADPDVSNRLSNKNFYGWSDAQAVSFDLICQDNSVAVVPISGYTTPGGYTFDITGGSGTYDPASKKISVTYNCSNTADGDFTITETYN